MFPLYSQQVRFSTSPPIVLPAPFIKLCLLCISDIAAEYTDIKTEADGARYWSQHQLPGHVPGLVGQIWNEAMHDTRLAWYADYYTDQYKKALDKAGDVPATDYNAAKRWITSQRQLHRKALLGWSKVRREIKALALIGDEEDKGTAAVGLAVLAQGTAEGLTRP